MNIDDVIEQVKAAELVPVPCTPPAKENDMELDGTLADFLAFVPRFCHKPVMVWRFDFGDAYFQTDIKAEPDGDTLDLRAIAPDMSQYEKHLDEEIGYQLLAWIRDTNAAISFSEFDSWVDEFLEERRVAVEAYKNERAESTMREREAKRQAEQALLARVEALIDDPAFRALKTHRAMYAYAVEKIEGLSELRDTKVKPIIAAMFDKIGVKKHTKGG